MPNSRDIKRRRDSVRNTRKILYAMKLVAAAKLRKTQEAVQRSSEYTVALSNLMQEIAAEVDTSQLNHPLMQERTEVATITVLVVGANRGLCGSYNTALARSLERFLDERREAHPEARIDVRIFGKKPAEYFRRKQRSYSSALEELPDDVARWPVEEACRDLEVDFLEGRTDEVWVFYTRFRSAVSTKPTGERIFPMQREVAGVISERGPLDETRSPSSGLVLFEPSAEAVFQSLVPRLVRARARQACLDAKTSEHASRMVAMENATKNADELVHKLTLQYNKERQRGITAQLLDIVGGAEAAQS